MRRDLCRYVATAVTKPSQGSIASVETQVGWLSKRDSCRHSQSMMKLVRAPHGFSGSVGRVAKREGVHVDTLPRPVRDEASQGSTASAERR